MFPDPIKEQFMEKNISQASMHKQILSTHDHDQGVKYHTCIF